MTAAAALLVLTPLAMLSVAVLAATLRGLPHYRPLPGPPAGARLPSVSVVTPACDEEESIESAIRSMLATADEVVAVDDRSTDGTGAILDRLATYEERLRVIHLRELPDGWLGKVRALDAGARVATGAFLLFADADAHLAPGALARAVGVMEAEGLDFLSLVPRIEPAGLLADTVFAFSQALVSVGTRVWAVGGPDPKAYGATGAFMLVRREALERTEGLGWLRMEVSDDFGLCLLVKRGGGRCSLRNGSDLVSLRWYASIGEMSRRMQKNFFAITGRCRPARCAGQGLLSVGLGLSPLGVALGGAPAVVAGAGGVGLVAAALIAARTFRRPLGPALAVHLGAVLTGLMSIRAGWIGGRIGGIEWRGVRYPSAELDAGRRVFL